MKKAKKVLLLVLCAVLLVGASVAGTVAYLTSTDKVENTFTVGNVAITLDESKVTEMGVKEGDTRVDTNKYHLLPGHTYTKDPIIHVGEDSEDCYMFVTISNGIATIEDTANTVASQMTNKGWKAVEGVANTYVYVGTAEGADEPLAVSKNANITVFEKIAIASTVDNATLADYKNATIVVNAYAVQKDGFEDKTAAEIWNATFGAPAEG